MLFHQRIDLQSDQLVKTHIQDRCSLFLCKFQCFCSFFRGLGLKVDSFGHAFCKAFLYLVTALASTKDFNNQVDHIAGFDQTFLNLPLLLLLGKKCIIFSGVYFKNKIHMMGNDLFQSQSLRSSVCYRKHVHTESILQSGLLIQHIGKVLHIRITLQFQNNTDSFLGRLVGDIHDIRSLLGLHKRCHII